MYANNRFGEAPRAMFRTAGGSIYTFAHPYLSGQLDSGLAVGKAKVLGTINEADITKSLKLNDTFFNATPAQDNALQEVMVDGSTITITNHVMAGKAALQVVPGSGLVRDGDLIAIAAFIVSAKDSVGGVLTRTRFTAEGALKRIYYGVSFANFPHDVDAGNTVPVYAITMLYGGWIEGITAGASTDKTLWAVGNSYGLKGNFVPFTISGIGAVNTANANTGPSTLIDAGGDPPNASLLGTAQSPSLDSGYDTLAQEPYTTGGWIQP